MWVCPWSPREERPKPCVMLDWLSGSATALTATVTLDVSYGCLIRLVATCLHPVTCQRVFPPCVQGCVRADRTPGDAGRQSEDPASGCPRRHPGQEDPHRHGRHGEVGLQPGQVREALKTKLPQLSRFSISIDFSGSTCI